MESAETQAKQARDYWRLTIPEAVLNSKIVRKKAKEDIMNTFGFGTMLDKVSLGLKCRRKCWEQGKYVYRAADDSSTLRTRNFNDPGAASRIYHPTPDMFATDWEVAYEMVDFAEALKHIRAGGKMRRQGWQDPRTYIQRFSPASDEIWIYFPAGTRQEWRPYCYDFLKTDWIKVDAIQIPAAPVSVQVQAASKITS